MVKIATFRRTPEKWVLSITENVAIAAVERDHHADIHGGLLPGTRIDTGGRRQTEVLRLCGTRRSIRPRRWHNCALGCGGISAVCARVLPTLRHLTELHLREKNSYGFKATFNPTFPVNAGETAASSPEGSAWAIMRVEDHLQNDERRSVR